MCCLSPGHWNLNKPFVGLGSASQNVAAPDFPTVLGPLQYYLLLLNQDCSFFDNEARVRQCRELLESFGGKALLPNHGPCKFLVFEKRENINAALGKQCKSPRGR